MFGLHDPSNLRYIFQLRVGLSHLRSHKKRHNFIDTPSDLCLCKQGVEDTYHFFLTCPLYVIPRAVLENKVHVILQKNNLNYFGNYAELYLYGNPSLNSSNNQEILSASIEFIISTNRFSIWVSGLLSSLPLPSFPSSLFPLFAFNFLFHVVCVLY